MFGKFLLASLLLIMSGLVLSNVITDPTNSFTTYEHIIDGELSLLPDGTYGKAVVVISREGLREGVQQRLQEAYARSPISVQFVANPADLTPLYLADLSRGKNVMVHGFAFQPLNYRNGWPGLDYSHLTATGERRQYTIQLRLANNTDWQIVQKTLSTNS